METQGPIYESPGDKPRSGSFGFFIIGMIIFTLWLIADIASKNADYGPPPRQYRQSR